MDGPSVESVAEQEGSSGSDEGGEVGMGVFGQVGSGQEPLALELEPVLLQTFLVVMTLDGFSSDVPSLGEELVALDSGDSELLVEPLRMFLPSQEFALEKERGQSGGKSVARSGGKMVRELKALKSSVNYDANVSSSRRSKKLGRTIDNVL
ncbi:hypothetical protein CJ030_MR5G003625 [Morella rubra]|uniref:Uncharacterized protein n=1 Tax=Morella rubra TaxID=262757 RepID=A0A6A1VL48_9ROSI|nr:hypothetical protein CJ030_MR5G003625 [Morella rubra]